MRFDPQYAGRSTALVQALLLIFGAGTVPPQWALAQASLSTLPVRSADLELSLGALDDPVLAFSRISDLAVDPAGRLYVLQPQEGTLTVLTPEGDLELQLGGRGQGPGEFLAPAALGWRGDTLWVMDAAQRRLSWFHRGRHVRTHRFAPLRLEPGERVAAQWPMADGSHFALVMRPFEEPAGHPANVLTIIRTAEGGTQGEAVAELRESYPFRLVIDHAEGRTHGSPLFSDFPLQSTDAWGARTAIVDRPFGEPPEGTIRLTTLEPSGDTVFSREYLVDVEPLTDQQWESRLSEALAAVDRPDRPYGAHEVEEASLRPRHWPSATRVVVGRDGHAWIGLAELPDRVERDWAVIDENGVPLYRVALPKGFRAFTASGDLVWGVWRDEFGIPHVQRYRMDRPGPGATDRGPPVGSR